MHSKKEQIFIGIIILLIGILFFMQKSGFLDFGNVALIALGFAFSLLYKTKKKSWSLLIGIFLLYIGISGYLFNMFSDFGQIQYILEDITLSIGFIFIGGALLALFHDKNKNGLLIPGSIIIGLGVNIFLRTVLPFTGSFSFYLCMMGSFMFIYHVGKYFLGKWPKYVSIILAILCISKIFFQITSGII